MVCCGLKLGNCVNGSWLEGSRGVAGVVAYYRGCLHVVVIMFTGYLVGYIAFRALFDRNPIMSTAGGILGLVLGMLVETLLFIIRTTDYSEKSSKPRPPSNLKFKKNQ
uniref:Uncharacterized protein n=1 Tax=Chenopodium quinoa TaxID=63459 RepID=A0A803L616_CHEQI